MKRLTLVRYRRKRGAKAADPDSREVALKPAKKTTYCNLATCIGGWQRGIFLPSGHLGA